MRSFLNEKIHASSRRKLNWNSINWKKVRKKVKELKIRIAKAVRIRASGSFHTRIGLLKCLSQCAGKLAYTVLRGLGVGDNPRPPDYLSSSISFSLKGSKKEWDCWCMPLHAQIYISFSSNAFASLTSAVSNPSVNQLCTGASRS